MNRWRSKLRASRPARPTCAFTGRIEGRLARERRRASQHVVQINTTVSPGCEHCFHQTARDWDALAEVINHYIEEHGYTLLHVGQQNGPQGPWHNTVAVLGTSKSRKELPVRPEPKIDWDPDTASARMA